MSLYPVLSKAESGYGHVYPEAWGMWAGSDRREINNAKVRIKVE